MCVSTFEYNRLTNELHGLETQQRFLVSLEKYGSSNLDKGAISFLNLGLTNLGLESVICNDVMTSDKGRLLITLENAESEKKSVGTKIKEVLSKMILLLKTGFQKLAEFFSKFLSFFKRKEKDVNAAHEVFTKGKTTGVPAEQATKMINSTESGSNSENASKTKTPDNEPTPEKIDAILNKKGKYVFKTSGNGWTAVVLNKEKMTYAEVNSRIRGYNTIFRAMEQDYLKVKDNHENDVEYANDATTVEYRFDGLSYIVNIAELKKEWDIDVSDDKFISFKSINEDKPAVNVEIDFSAVNSISSEVDNISKQISKIKQEIDDAQTSMLRNRDTDLKIAKQILWVKRQRYALLKVAAKIWTDYIYGVYTYTYGSGAAAAMNKSDIVNKYIRPLDK